MANEFGAMPEFNQAVKNKMQATEDFKLQQQMMQAPSNQLAADPNTAINQVSTQASAAQAQQGLQAQQQALGSQLQANQQSLADQGFKDQAKNQRSQVQLAQSRRQAENQLADMDQDFKKRMVDDQMQFREDKRGKVMDSEQQMMDYLVAKQADDQEWQRFAREAQQGHQEKMQALDYAANVLNQTLSQDNATLIRKYGEDNVRRMRHAQQEAEKKKREAAKKGSTFGKVLGGAQAAAGVGLLMAGQPSGAAMIGSGLGNIIGSSGG